MSLPECSPFFSPHHRFTLRSDNGLPAFAGIYLLSLSISEHCRDWRASDQGSGRDDGAFWDNHNAIANAIVFAVRIDGLTLGCDHDSFPKTSVFVNNGALNVAAASDAKWWKAWLWLPGFCLVPRLLPGKSLAPSGPSCGSWCRFRSRSEYRLPRGRCAHR